MLFIGLKYFLFIYKTISKLFFAGLGKVDGLEQKWTARLGGRKWTLDETGRSKTPKERLLLSQLTGPNTSNKWMKWSPKVKIMNKWSRISSLTTFSQHYCRSKQRKFMNYSFLCQTKIIFYADTIEYQKWKFRFSIFV